MPFVPAALGEWCAIVAERYGVDSDAYALLTAARTALHDSDDLSADSPALRGAQFIDSIMDEERGITVLDFVATCLEEEPPASMGALGRKLAQMLMGGVGSLRQKAKKRRQSYIQEQTNAYLILAQSLGYLEDGDVDSPDDLSPLESDRGRHGARRGS